MRTFRLAELIFSAAATLIVGLALGVRMAPLLPVERDEICGESPGLWIEKDGIERYADRICYQLTERRYAKERKERKERRERKGTRKP